MDTGGNSTELISVENKAFKNYTSIPLGSINITEKIKVNKEVVITVMNFFICIF